MLGAWSVLAGPQILQDLDHEFCKIRGLPASLLARQQRRAAPFAKRKPGLGLPLRHLTITGLRRKEDQASHAHIPAATRALVLSIVIDTLPLPSPSSKCEVARC